MLNQFYELCEMVCCGVFVLMLIKGMHLVSNILINYYKIKKIRNGDNDESQKK